MIDRLFLKIAEMSLGCGDCDTCGDVCQTAAQENAEKFYLCALACGGISSCGSVLC